MWIQKYLGGKVLRWRKEDTRKQYKTRGLGWEMEKQGRDLQNEESPLTKW